MMNATCPEMNCLRNGHISTIGASLTSPNDVQPQLKSLKASAYGNFMEWFDFTLYGFFAMAIGANFFPASDPLLSTMASYTVFAAGFIARPVGAFYFGRQADRWGRKRVLIITLLLMGLATLLVIAAPSYRDAGLVGPLMVVCGRLLAGLAAAGEIGAAAAMAIEAAPKERRGRWGGMFSASTYLGVAAAGFVSLLCYGLLGSDATNDWGWRVGYSVGLLIVPLGWWARRSVQVDQPSPPSVQPDSRKILGMILRVAGLTAFGSAVFYVVIIFMPVYASRQLGIPLGSAMATAMVASVVTGLAAITGGWLSDFHGRKRLMNSGLLLSLLLAWPLFLHLMRAPSTMTLAVFQLSCAAGLGIFVGGALPLMVESFSPSRRALGVGLGYSLGVMLFGGMAPVVNTLALSKGLALAPMVYVSVAALITWTALVLTPETGRTVGHHRAPAPT